MTTFLSDIVLAGANDIQFKNTSGANTGKIESDGNNLVLSNAVGDILLGDGASDVYIGDGTNNVDILFEQSGSIKAEDGSSGVTLTLGSGDTTLALGSSISSAATVLGALTVGVNDTGHDVRFYGATSGAYMLWDESEDGLKIIHPTDDAGLEIYTVSGGSPTTSQFKVGRDASQYFGVYTEDRTAHLIHRQDETDSGAMYTSSELWGGGSGNDSWTWKHGTNTGGSLATVMTLDKAGQLTITGEIEGGSLDINGNADISGTLITGTTEITKATSTSGTTGTTFLELDNNVGSDISQQQTFIDFKFTDTNANYTPQVRIGAQVGPDADANSIEKEGAGSFVVYTAPIGSDSSGSSTGLAEAFRVSHDKSATFAGNTQLNGTLTVGIDDTGYDVKFYAATSGGYMLWDESANRLLLPDATTLGIGTGSDLLINHSGTATTIDNSTGNLLVRQYADDSDIIFQCDDGSGGVTPYLTLDGGLGYTTVQKNMRFDDNAKANFGNSGDLYVYHDATQSYIYNYTGDLKIINAADDKDIVFQSDDGSGGVETYFFLDGSANGTNPLTVFPDNSRLTFGTGNDLNISHEANNSYIQNITGDLYIKQRTDDGDMIFQCDDGSGGDATYFYLDGSEATHDGSATTALYTNWPDKSRISLGTSNDLHIHHDGSNSYIKHGGDGDLKIKQTRDDGDIIFECDDGSGGTTEYFRLDGSSTQTIFSKNQQHADNVTTYYGNAGDLSIYHDGSNSYIKHVSGASGDLIIEQSVDDADIIFKSDDGSGGVAIYTMLDGSEGRISTKVNNRFDDSARLELGTSGDLDLYHDGSHSYINNATGDLVIRNQADDGDISFKSDNGSGGDTTYFFLDGSLADGTYTYTRWADNDVVAFGDSQDFLIYHNATNTLLYNSVGDIQITNTADDKDISFRCDDGSGGTTAYLTLDGSAGTIEVAKTTRLADSVSLKLGSATDLELFHDGTNSFINNNTGPMFIRQNVDDGDIRFQSDDGSGGVTDYLKLDGSATNIYVQKNLKLADDVLLQIGDSGDLNLNTDGSHGYISNVTGNLYVRNQADDSDIIFESDDGSGGYTPYLTLDGGNSIMWAYKQIRFTNGTYASFGTSGRFNIYHDNSNAYMGNSVGNITLTNDADDSDIIFQADNGSGGVTPYLTLDGSEGRTVVAKAMRFNDSTSLQLGSDADIQMHHDGSNGFFNNITGDLTIKNNTDDGDIIFQSDDGSGGVETYLIIDGSARTVNFSRHTFQPDGIEARFGTNNDLKIYHDASNSYIDQTGTGNLYIRNTQEDGLIYMQSNYNGSVSSFFYLHGAYSSNNPYTIFPDNSIAAFGNSADLKIYHNGTDSVIDNYVGDFYISQKAADKDLIFRADDGAGGFETYFFLDGSAGGTNPITIFPDSSYLKFGSGSDLSLSHNGTNSHIENSTGDLNIINYANDKDVVLQSDDGSGGNTAYLTLDGSAGHTTVQKEINFEDSIEATFGASSDLRIFHNGSHTYLSNQTGDLYIRNQANDKDIIFQSDDGSGGNAAYLTLDGSAAETKVDKDMRFSDNVNLRIGTNSDVVIVHDNSNFTTTNYTGNYNIINQQLDGDIVFQTDDGSGGVETYLTIDGGSQEIIATKPIVTGESQIKVLPHHFMSNEDGGANKSAQFRDDTIIGVRTSADDAELYAFVEIPYGKTARTVTVYGNDTSLVVNVYESDINAGALTDKTPGAGCVVGTECDITDVAYSATNYLVIKVTTVSYTNDIVYGAVVTIG